MLLTKHCQPEFRELMLSGCFKIGSHTEYSKGEATGALSDTEEGNGGFYIKGSLKDPNFSIGTNHFYGGCYEAGSQGNGFEYQASINSFMFCASKGDYNPDRHLKIINGDANKDYSPNPSYTAFLILDEFKLGKALADASSEFFNEPTRWRGIPVSYGSRHEEIAVENFKGFTDDELWLRLAEQATLKPTRFGIEEEYRFYMDQPLGRPIPPYLLTKDLSKSIQLAFSQAVVDAGDIMPRL